MTAWTPLSPEYDCPRYVGVPRVYAIASSPRTGSHLLGHMLGATGRFGSPLEYLHTAHVDVWKKHLGVDSFEEVLKELFARRTTPNGWFGFKAHWFQYAHARREWDLDRLAPVERFIYIERRDVLMQAISAVVARQTASWMSLHESKGEPVYDDEEITQALKRMRESAQNWEDYFKAERIEPIRVVYEDLTQDPLPSLNAILREFGFTEMDSPPTVRLSKQASAINDEWAERYMSRKARLRRLVKKSGRYVARAPRLLLRRPS